MAYVAHFGVEAAYEFAKTADSRIQLVSFSRGEGEVTAGLLDLVSSNCTSAAEKMIPWKQLWLTRDEAEPAYYGINNAIDIQYATDCIVKFLARCSGNCSECPLADEGHLTLQKAMELKIKDQ